MNKVPTIFSLLLVVYLGQTSASVILDNRGADVARVQGLRLLFDLIEPDHDHDLRQQTDERIWCYIRDACITGGGYKEVIVETIDLCINNCLEKLGARCQSIEYTSATQKCHFSEARSNSSNYKEPCPHTGIDFTEKVPKSGPYCDADGNWIGGCRRDLIPNCGSDGVTYCGSCAVLSAQCKDPCLTTVRGRCKDSDCDANGNFIGVCTSDLVPNCGSDGVTYFGNCDVLSAKCKNPCLTTVRGHCKDSDPNCDANGNFIGRCTYDLIPRCGSDGQTYYGDCGFASAKCKNPGLTVMPGYETC